MRAAAPHERLARRSVNLAMIRVWPVGRVSRVVIDGAKSAEDFVLRILVGMYIS
jgi:hypothetical protein